MTFFRWIVTCLEIEIKKITRAKKSKWPIYQFSVDLEGFLEVNDLLASPDTWEKIVLTDAKERVDLRTALNRKNGVDTNFDSWTILYLFSQFVSHCVHVRI